MEAQPRSPQAGPLVAALGELREKYRELLSMRHEREALERRGISSFTGEALRQRNARGRALARRFPGALRELDVLDSASIERRLDGIDEELVWARAHPDARTPRTRWLRVILDFHGMLLQALAIKGWLVDRGLRGAAVTPSVVADFRAWFAVCSARQSALESVDAAFLQRHLAPPGGRIMALIWECLSRRHGTTEEELRALIFGAEQ